MIGARHRGFVPESGNRPEAWRDNWQLASERRARVERILWIGAAAFLIVGAFIATNGLR